MVFRVRSDDLLALAALDRSDHHAMISETLEHQLRIARASELTMRVLYLRRLLPCARFSRKKICRLPL
jgi:hypothetical protein